jgi:acyl-CoA dehydrogenase
MNFDYSPEERALAEQARRFLSESAPLSLLRDMLEGRGSERATALWSAASELGLAAIAIPEEYGGAEMGYTALCALAEEVGRAAAPLPLLPSRYLAAEALLHGGTDAQKRRWLPGLARGELIGTALVGPDPVGAIYAAGKISGVVQPVAHGMEAAVLVVSAQDGDASSPLYLVDLEQPGVQRTALKTIDDSRPHARLQLNAALAEPLGDPGRPEAIDRLLTRAAVLVAFEQLGGADACLQMTLNYVQQRRTFARLIGSYQAVKHRLADVYVANELARSNAYYAAWALERDAPELALAAATARVSATEAYELASENNIQLHGGIGFTWEADPHLHYRRSRLLAQTLGPLGVWQDRLIKALDQPEKTHSGL